MSNATFQTADLTPETLITVCAECLQASCWLAEFVCDEYRSANIVKLPVSRLRELNQEHPDWWAKEIRSRAGCE